MLATTTNVTARSTNITGIRIQGSPTELVTTTATVITRMPITKAYSRP
jgi:hypothetical protein